jgi:uncharacterized protein
MPNDALMILGASTRAAAQSAVRADFSPRCVDHFADEDLCEVAEVLPLSVYPCGLLDAATSALPSPWMYTGALENHPGLLKKLATLRPLYGNPADVVVRVRNPFAVARALANAGLPALPVLPADQPPAADGRWVIKPRRGAAGRGIRIWEGPSDRLTANPRREPYYFQRRAFGQPHSALYLATSAQTVLIGVARQLIGEPRLGAGPFAYCGSIGPVVLAEPQTRQPVRWGEILGSEFRLRGLFGVDFLLDENGDAWLTEVNPRYTASVEVFESALDVALLDYHVRASEAFAEVASSQRMVEELHARLDSARRSPGHRTCGKAVVYAPFSLRSPNLAEIGRLPEMTSSRARIADRPHPGTLVPARSPLCTLLVDDLKWPPKAAQAALTPFETPLALLLSRLESDRGRIEAVRQPEAR